PMPWYHGWNVLAVAMLFQAVTFGIGIYSFTFWVAPWSAEFAVGRGEVMTVFITLQVAMGAMAPLAGRAVDRLSLRGLIIAGALCLAAGLLLAGRAGALWHLNLVYGTLIVAGLLLAGPLAGQTLAARWFVRRRGTALGVVTVGTSIGGFLLPPLVTWLHGSIGWRAANDWLALFVVLAIVPPVWLLVRNAPGAGLRAVEGADANPAGRPSPSTATLDILRQRVFWLTVLGFTPLATAFGGAQQNLGPYASDLGIDAQAAAYLVSVMALVMIGAKVFFGAMADRWDIRALFLLTVVGLAIAFGLMLLELSYFALVLVCALLGFVAGGFLPLLGALVSQNFDIRAFGQVMGMLGPFTTLAAVGPWIAGYLRDTTGSYDLAWLTLSALLVPSAAAIALLKPRPTRGAQRE
ncbi:MAG: MFS transporter, partial [Gammaproteobacteria bacterium]|nr:MFS transporter [Gammaproteobacteria bacterium]MDE0271209.1 MFS transporter [Gammaproteobacteria bacterium]